MRFTAVLLSLCLFAGSVAADVALSVIYLKVAVPEPPILSNLDPVPDDLGYAGAATAIDDASTTGRFLGQTYTLTQLTVPIGDDPLVAATEALGQTQLLLLDAPGSVQLAIADLPLATDAILMNVSAEEGSLRDADCRANLLHAIPSVDMRADALAQFLVARRLDDLVMIAGTHSPDVAYADGVRRSLRKFGLTLRAEKTWRFDADMRRNAAQEVPLFTQDLGDYDAMIVADEVGDFGRYILYNTWAARPIVGSEGLSALTWTPVMEQWGAAQLQSRFSDKHGRSMGPRDYAAWAAVGSLAEAMTRTNQSAPAALRDYILSDQFELAGFKGRPLTWRDWNGQLRQPIALAHPRAMVAQAPLEGFLHQFNELDTLGRDRPESQCTAFGG